jgi:hypothetical protein
MTHMLDKAIYHKEPKGHEEDKFCDGSLSELRMLCGEQIRLGLVNSAKAIFYRRLSGSA